MYYQWYKDGSAISGATSSSYTILSVLGSSAGNYYVKVSNAGGWVLSDNATLNVDAPPGIITQPQSQTAVQGQNAAFSVVASGTGPLSYQWFLNGVSVGATGTSATLSLLGVTTNQAGAYTAVMANSMGSITSAVATLTVLVPAGIATQPQSQSVVQGQHASFSVVASGTAPFHYQWSFNGSVLSGASASALMLTNVQPTQAGGYSVLVTNSAGSVISQAATLTVIIPPAITTQPQSQSVVLGQNASFYVAASGTAPVGYQWTFNGSALPGATATTLTLTNVQADQAGGYSVLVTNTAGSATSQAATLTVIIPPAITNQPQSQVVIQSQKASFSVGASGTAPFTYQWFFNGIWLGNNNPTLTVSGAQPNKAGNYTVVVSNPAGSATSAVATLTVLVPPTIATPPQSQSVVQGQQASFSVVASGTAPLGYQWNFNGLPLPGATDSALTFTNVQTAQAGGYSVLVTNSAGAVSSVVASLAVAPPTVTLSVASGSAMSSNGFTFQLSVPAGLTYVIQASSDFQTWTPITTNVAAAGTNVLTDVAAAGSIVFTDTAAASNPIRFYRAVVQ